jgi:hypothetical protein
MKEPAFPYEEMVVLEIKGKRYIQSVGPVKNSPFPPKKQPL